MGQIETKRKKKRSGLCWKCSQKKRYLYDPVKWIQFWPIVKGNVREERIFMTKKKKKYIYIYTHTYIYIYQILNMRVWWAKKLRMVNLRKGWREKSAMSRKSYLFTKLTRSHIGNWDLETNTNGNTAIMRK